MLYLVGNVIITERGLNSLKKKTRKIP
jgi:hypothetical protein